MKARLGLLPGLIAAAAFAAAEPSVPKTKGFAEEALREAGPDAFREVAQAALSEDAEARARARRVLAAWNWPTPELVARCGECPPGWQAALLAEALRHPVPVEMDPVEVDLLTPEEHLARQAGFFAAAKAVARLPRETALPPLKANLADEDLPKYLTLTAIAEIGGPEATEILLAYADEESTAGWVSPPALARLGRPDVLEAALARSQKRIERRRALDEDLSVALYNHACLMALAGRTDEVRGPLEESLRHGAETDALWARIDPDFRELRETPWFKEVLARYGAYGISSEGKK